MSGDPNIPSPAATLRFQGDLVRLAAFDPEGDAEAFALWHNTPMSARLAGWEPVLPINKQRARELLEDWVKKAPESIYLSVRTVADDRFVGGVSLKNVSLIDQRAELGVAIHQPEDWGMGFGREATILALRYGFNELGLHRVWLTTSNFNERAIRLYENLGFRHEGTAREHIRRDGRWWDLLYMGLLRDEFND
jgi:RimJ/RimL family protein N-acetyltransferase